MCDISSHLPRAELESRWYRCRRQLAQDVPEAGGLLVFSRLNIYYLTGSLATGVLWLPLEGSPVLLCRRGQGRAGLESPLERILSFRSFGEIAALLAEAGSPLSKAVAAEKKGLSWALAGSLQHHLPELTFLAGDTVLMRVRAVKSEWELVRLRRAGSRHAACLQSLLPPFLVPGMSEAKIAHRIWEIFFAQGHQGMLRMSNFGEEIFLGHIAVGESGNYPSVLNGPLGLRGVHPAVPHMGSPAVTWKAGELLTVDVGFGLEGYITDKTQVYWPDAAETIPAAVRSAHDFCIEVQGRLTDRLRPGAVIGDLSAAAFALARKRGFDEGFMALGGNKVSFVGHGIGLSIDEPPVLAENSREPIEEGMVIAVEPKVGLPGIGMVGVENTFEITGHGASCLTGHDHSIISIPRREGHGRVEP